MGQILPVLAMIDRVPSHAGADLNAVRVDRVYQVAGWEARQRLAEDLTQPVAIPP